MLCKRNTSVHLEKLEKYTPYNITVAAFTKVGIGNKSEIKKTWTDEDCKLRLIFKYWQFLTYNNFFTNFETIQYVIFKLRFSNLLIVNQV